MRLITPLVLIIVGIVLFFTYTNSAYDQLKGLQEEEAKFDDALRSAEELEAIKSRLIESYNNFAQTDLDRLEKLLPDNIDRIRLIISMDDIAARYGLTLQGVNVSPVSVTRSGENASPGTVKDDLGAVQIGFAVDAPYEVFKEFMGDLEKSLRLVDTVNFSFSPANDEFDPTIMSYSVSLATYWIK